MLYTSTANFCTQECALRMDLHAILKIKTLKNQRRIESATETRAVRRLARCVTGVGVAAPWLEPSADNKHASWAGRGGSSSQRGERGDGSPAGEAGPPLQLLRFCQNEHNNFQKVTLSVKEGVRFLRQRDCDALWLYILSQRGPRPEFPHISVLRRWALYCLSFVFALLLRPVRQLCGALPCHFSGSAPVTCLSRRGVHDRRVCSKRHHFVSQISSNLVKYVLKP